MSEKAFAQILTEVSAFTESAADLTALQNFIVEIIPHNLPYYNWTGFYMLDSANPEMLVLGPFRGAPTEHVHIPVSQGICGAAVAQNHTVIVDDVHSDSRYLACSLETRSEIVVPIRVNGTVVVKSISTATTLPPSPHRTESFLKPAQPSSAASSNEPKPSHPAQNRCGESSPSW